MRRQWITHPDRNEAPEANETSLLKTQLHALVFAPPGVICSGPISAPATAPNAGAPTGEDIGLIHKDQLECRYIFFESPMAREHRV
jgi:hypothetical protein